MNCLALDLGTNTGYAYNDGGYFYCGTWKLATEKELRAQRAARGDRRGDIRVLKLFRAIQLLLSQVDFDCICYEDVQFSSSTMQTQLWSSLRAAVWLSDQRANSSTRVDCVPVGTLKKFAGHGSATKEQMGLFLCAVDNRFCRIGKINPKFFFRQSEESLQPVDDNVIDAVWVHRWAKTNLSRKI